MPYPRTNVSQAHPSDGRRRRSCWLALGLASLIGSAAGCVREPLPELCPKVAEGELVISELRSNTDSFGDYIELYNASSRTVDLEGLRVRLRGSGGDELEFFVRGASELEIEPGGYFVIGPGLPDDPEVWIDYSIGWDISGGDPNENEAPRELFKSDFSAAFVELEACGELIDQVFYDHDELPGVGTLACGNADNPPSATTNDTASSGCWCVDDLPDDQGLLGIGLPGSPGEPNRCP
ncbi:hypothetical protein ENSA5_06920 [Enhygromyxa salina]|uniref:LTD domain-containing protein n=1 Tax=Enhygromyxa salina TaxID=215803 RepID=A0A2S9YHN5_9BACT|nr:lamin tail domain-containing protein [Enhygromyxa salina]PRQ04526.1 hypothetical protein ENSA5_06920 [Enhygromyxa salina]